MHILIIPSWYPAEKTPVAGIFFKEQAEALSGRGLNVGVITAQSYSVRSLLQGLASNIGRSPQIHISKVGSPNSISQSHFHYPIFFNKLNFYNKVKYFIKLYKLYEKKYSRPDVIHAHCARWGGYSAYMISNETGIPYIVTEHESGFFSDNIKEWEKKYISLTYKNAKHIIAVSESLKNKISPYLSNKNCSILGNILSQHSSKNLETNIKSNNSSIYKFITVANLVRSKKIDELLIAFEELIKRRDQKNISLCIIGDGPERNRLEKITIDLKIDNHVQFKGQCDKLNVLNHMSESDCFVLPSRFETFGVVYIEALSMGIPVIATRCGGPEDFVNDQVGYLVSVGNKEQLIRAMISSINHNSMWKKKAGYLKNYALSKFGSKPITDKLLEIYCDARS